MTKKNLLLIELNEINFEFVEKYIKLAKLPNFQKLLESGICRTSSENNYEELEPWIQWVSAHTGLDYSSHKIFRLGDIIHHSIPQIFEKVEMSSVRSRQRDNEQIKNTGSNSSIKATFKFKSGFVCV